jgi:CheY-like chemotaxis protein
MNTKKESILVVEDEDIMRESLVDWFSSEGHKVDSAMDGDKALNKYDLEDYDVMIIDLKLPGRDGLSILSDVKVKNPKVKVVIITAYPSVDTANEAMQRGAIDYLQKPFELNQLSTSIREAYGVEVDGVTAAPVEAPPEVPPIVEEEIVSPCIWMQAGIVPKRMCTLGYQCDSACDFHAALMKQVKFRNDPRIKPFIDKLTTLFGRHQCRYIMSGEISQRYCPRLYRCENCEFDQINQDKVDHQLAMKAANRKRRREERLNLE